MFSPFVPSSLFYETPSQPPHTTVTNHRYQPENSLSFCLSCIDLSRSALVQPAQWVNQGKIFFRMLTPLRLGIELIVQYADTFPNCYRQELLGWLNNLLQLNVTKVEQCGTGCVRPLACQDRSQTRVDMSLGGTDGIIQSGIMSDI